MVGDGGLSKVGDGTVQDTILLRYTTSATVPVIGLVQSGITF